MFGQLSETRDFALSADRRIVSPGDQLVVRIVAKRSIDKDRVVAFWAGGQLPGAGRPQPQHFDVPRRLAAGESFEFAMRVPDFAVPSFVIGRLRNEWKLTAGFTGGVSRAATLDVVVDGGPRRPERLGPARIESELDATKKTQPAQMALEVAFILAFPIVLAVAGVPGLAPSTALLVGLVVSAVFAAAVWRRWRRARLKERALEHFDLVDLPAVCPLGDGSQATVSVNGVDSAVFGVRSIHTRFATNSDETTKHRVLYERWTPISSGRTQVPIELPHDGLPTIAFENRTEQINWEIVVARGTVDEPDLACSVRQTVLVVSDRSVGVVGG